MNCEAEQLGGVDSRLNGPDSIPPELPSHVPYFPKMRYPPSYLKHPAGREPPIYIPPGCPSSLRRRGANICCRHHRPRQLSCPSVGSAQADADCGAGSAWTFPVENEPAVRAGVAEVFVCAMSWRKQRL